MFSPAEENGTPPAAQNVEQGEPGPRERNNLDIAAIAEFDRKGSRRVESDTVVGSDLVAETNDDERRHEGGISSRNAGSSKVPCTNLRCRQCAARRHG